MHHEFLSKSRPTRKSEVRTTFPLVHDGTSRQRCNLAVLGENDTKFTCVFERSPHQPLVLHSGTIICEEANTNGRQISKRSQLVTCSPDGN
jgi:hypothetical protein